MFINNRKAVRGHHGIRQDRRDYAIYIHFNPQHDDSFCLASGYATNTTGQAAVYVPLYLTKTNILQKAWLFKNIPVLFFRSPIILSVSWRLSIYVLNLHLHAAVCSLSTLWLTRDLARVCPTTRFAGVRQAFKGLRSSSRHVRFIKTNEPADCLLTSINNQTTHRDLLLPWAHHHIRFSTQVGFRKCVFWTQ